MSGFIIDTNKGILVPDTADLKSEVQAEFKAVFGEELSLEDATPQGRLIDHEVALRQKMLETGAFLYSQRNPDTAGGVDLDALFRLLGSQRKAATKTVVVATITGAAGTVISAGKRAQNDNGDFFELANDATIPVSNTIDVDFRAVNAGAVSCPANTLTTIIDGVDGWETIDNSLSGVLGSNEMSDAQARRYRLDTLAGFGSVSVEAIRTNVYKVDGLLSCLILENTQATPQTINTRLVDSHTIEVVVDGGSDADIAQAIFEKRSQAGLQGNVSVPIAQTDLPDFIVKFSRATPVYAVIRITLKANGTANLREQVGSAILDYSNGLFESEAGFVVGKTVYTAELGAPIGAVSRQSDIRKIEIKEKFAGSFGDTLNILPLQVAKIQNISDIEVVLV